MSQVWTSTRTWRSEVRSASAEILGMLEGAGFALFKVEGFRRASGTITPLNGQERRRFLDQRAWTAEELYFMCFVYARKPVE